MSGIGSGDTEKTAGLTPYKEVLQSLHDIVDPSFYLEVGIRNGDSIALAKCPSVGIDPAPRINRFLGEAFSVFRQTSDDFFAHNAPYVLTKPVDMAFIDGMHLFEFALRDFINIEKYSHKRTVAIFDDILPNHPEQARRDRVTNVWMGDVWKIVHCLRAYRPDLKLHILDTSPSGLLLVDGLNPQNTTLQDSFEEICLKYLGEDFQQPPSGVITREEAIPFERAQFQTYFKGLETEESPFTPPLPDKSANVKLSVVVIAYNMEREIPKTIRSLSPHMQRDITRDEYEIILVDNGSTAPFDRTQCEQWGAQLTIEYMENAGASPVAAINRGIELAKGNLVSVMIDGARLASPGLLSSALGASKTYQRPLIATPGYHLGSEVQMDSVKKGYNQEAEDKLLGTVPWTIDGYCLFDISAPAGSSALGPFMPMMETNAIFATKEMWLELGGFDPSFQQSGGGLVNIDTYTRALSLAGVQHVVLFGEGNFHQVHGGVATNEEGEHPFERFNEEYKKIRGQYYQPHQLPDNTVYFGLATKQVLPIIEFSARMAQGIKPTAPETAAPEPKPTPPKAMAKKRGLEKFIHSVKKRIG